MKPYTDFDLDLYDSQGDVVKQSTRDMITEDLLDCAGILTEIVEKSLEYCPSSPNVECTATESDCSNTCSDCHSYCGSYCR